MNTSGVNVIGNVSANSGLGVQARQIVNLLVQRGVPVSVLDVDAGSGRSGHDSRFAALTAHSVTGLPHEINLFILQPASIFHFLAAHHGFCFAERRFNAAIAMWELPTIPAHWLPGLQALDAVVAASGFLQHTFATHVGDTAIVSAPCPLYMPDDIVADRAAHGLDNDRLIFVTSFDPHSDPERKNPYAAIRSFVQAFGDADDVWLVVKVNGHRPPPLEALSAGRANIRIIDTMLSYRETLSLYASCDVFVSLHRAEGLGLALMEAMALGKPVIATAWSGNTSFMDHANACLVGYRLVPVRGGLPVYRALDGQARWAEPSETQAAAWMRELKRDPARRLSIGAAARASIAAYQAAAKQACFLDELHTLAEARAFLPPKPRPTATDLWAAAHVSHEAPRYEFFEGLARHWDRHVGWRLRRS